MQVVLIICVADRRPVPAHLPLAWTHSSTEEIQTFMAKLENLTKAVQSQPDTELNGPLGPYKPQLV